MAVILEIKAGPFAGQRVAVLGGQTVTVGRTSNANFAVPHDTFMSGVHFVVEDGPKGCVLTDKSRNGTFVNGARVTQAALNAGDEVKSGGTIFVVREVDERPLARPVAQPVSPIPAPLPVKEVDRTVPLDAPGRREQSVRPPIVFEATPPAPVTRSPGKPLLTIGGWTFSVVPENWSAQGEFGLQRDTPDAFPSSAVTTQEQLGSGLSLQEYVEAQLAMLRQYLREPQMDAVVPPRIHGAEESIAVEVLYKTKDGQAVFYRRVYARVGRTVGILTFTTLQSELAQVRPHFDQIVSGAGFASGASA